MKPMFSYMGSKWRIAKQYGIPQYQSVIEPFAGSACYSLYHNVQKALLYEVNPRIVGIWQYLIKATSREILRLPLDFETVETLAIPQEAKWLLGFWINKGCVEPCKIRSAWARQYNNSGDCKVWGEPARSRIAIQVNQIRKWQIVEKEYSSCPNITATWFIDPPYVKAGKHYTFSQIEYTKLGVFCYRRHGQVIVCENKGATWLPFKPLCNARGTFGVTRSGISKEVVFKQGGHETDQAWE